MLAESRCAILGLEEGEIELARADIGYWCGFPLSTPSRPLAQVPSVRFYPLAALAASSLP
jgi:hypothetical protein